MREIDGHVDHSSLMWFKFHLLIFRSVTAFIYELNHNPPVFDLIWSPLKYVDALSETDSLAFALHWQSVHVSVFLSFNFFLDFSAIIFDFIYSSIISFIVIVVDVVVVFSLWALLALFGILWFFSHFFPSTFTQRPPSSWASFSCFGSYLWNLTMQPHLFACFKRRKIK